MPRYLIHSPERFPEVFDAVKSIGEVDADMPTFIVLATDKDIDEVAAIVTHAAGENNSLVVQAADARYQGDGRVAKLSEFIEATENVSL